MNIIENRKVTLIQRQDYKLITVKMDQKQNQQQQAQRRYKQLLEKISYTDDAQGTQARKYKYSHQSIQPFVYFWKLLALRPCDKNHKSKLVLNVPDTIVFNDGDNPIMWFYTNPRGQVCRMDNIPYNQITQKLTEGAFQKQLVAVVKKASFGYGGVSGNDVKLISSSEMKIVLSNVLSSRGELNVIQKYVKSTSSKPSVVRTCWRMNGPNQSWILSSEYQYTSQAKVPQINKFIVNTKNHKTFSATKCGSEKYMAQTLKYLKNIADFVGKHLGIRFLELVGDFVKDQGGNWWFINAKAFILDTDKKVSHKPISMHDDEPIEQKPKKKLQTYTKCKKCKYCYKTVAQHLMNHKLTLMMILQCDQHLIRMGKNFPWLQRCYNQHVGNVNLYIEHKVCDSCYKLYIEIQRLVQLQNKMAKLLGVQVAADDKNAVSITSVPAFKGQSPQFGSRLQKVKYDTQMPKGWALPLDQPIQVSLLNDKSLNLAKCRFLIFINGIRDIPRKVLEEQNQYMIQYKILGHQIRYKLSFRQFQLTEEDPDNLIKITMDKIKVIYFFAQGRAQIKEYIKQKEYLQVHLLENGQIIGHLNIELNEFCSTKVIKRDFFKMFSGAKIFPYLSWGLNITLGLHEGQKIESSKLKLTHKDHLFFPQHDYCNADPLPDEWIQFFSQKPIKMNASTSSGLYKNKNKIGRQATNQSIISNYSLLDKQIEDYGRRKAVSSYNKIKRKPYY